MNVTALVALSCFIALMMGVAGLYMARIRMPRPPVGVYVPADIAAVCVGVVLAPLLYGGLSGATVSALFSLVLCLAVQFTLAPVCGGRVAWCLATAAAVLTVVVHGRPAAVRACTGLLIALAVVGVANLWAQSGMRSSHVAGLAGALTCYDLVATTLTQVTQDFFTQVQGRPFAPVFQLTGGPQPVGVGLGDLLLLVLYPLVAARAFGRWPALGAAIVGLAVTSGISVLFALGVLTAGFPLLTALGPLIVAQHLVWSRREGGERTTAEWRGEAPPSPPRRAGLPADEVTAALAVAVPPGLPEGTWLAVSRGGRVTGTGETPGRARRAAQRNAGPEPVLVRQI